MVRTRIARSLSIAALAFTAAAAPAGEIFVAGQQGVVMRGDSITGGFRFMGTCGGPVRSMTVVNDKLLLSDNSGRIYRVSLSTGVAEGSFVVPGHAAAIATLGNDLLVGDVNETMLRVNPLTGTVLQTIEMPVPVSAIAVRDGFIYVSGPQLSVYRGSAADMNFSYFTCSCFTSVNALIATDENLFLADEMGAVWRMSRATGDIQTIFFVESAPRALTFVDDELVVGRASTFVTRLDEQDGTIGGELTVPIQISAFAARNSTPCVGDLTGDGMVELGDLSQLLNAFGASAAGDLDADGATGLSDLALLLSNFGQVCD